MCVNAKSLTFRMTNVFLCSLNTCGEIILQIEIREAAKRRSALLQLSRKLSSRATRYLTSVVDNEFRLLRVRQAVHEYCNLERAVLFGYEA